MIVNCAAYTDVDGAETNEALATAINGDGVRALADRCRAIGATLVHFGTDYVFDGRASAPYPVDAKVDAQGAYGRSKAAGERALVESGAPHLYVRTSWLYAPWAKNFVRTIASLARQRESLRVVDDQRGRPTSAEHLARADGTIWLDGTHQVYIPPMPDSVLSNRETTAPASDGYVGCSPGHAIGDWLVDDSDLQLRYGTGLDFAYSYEDRLVGGADPEGDATLTLETCQNHRCTTSSLVVAEGVRYLRFGIDPSQYHAGRNVFTFTLTLTDNGFTSTDTLTLRATVTRRPSAVIN